MEETTPAPPERRRFLEGMIRLCAGGIAALAVLPGVGYALKRLFGPPATRKARLLFASSADEQSATYVLARLEGADEGSAGVFYKLAADGQPIVLSSMCTHAGCPVEWKATDNKFFCACHQGWFDSEGKQAGGPPPKPLERLVAKREAEGVFVLIEEA